MSDNLQRGKLYIYTINPRYTHEMFLTIGINDEPIRRMKTGDIVVYLDTEVVSDDLIVPFAARTLHYERWKQVICDDLVGWVIGDLTLLEEQVEHGNDHRSNEP